MRSFIRTFALVATLGGAPVVAHAQAEAIKLQVPGEGAPSEAPVPTEGAGEAGHGEAHGGGHGDPTTHYNWFKLSYRNKDILGGPMGDGKLGNEPLEPGHDEEPMSAPFVLMLLNFGILLVILAKLGGPAARKMAETRSDEIKGALDEAAKLRKQAAAKLDEYNAKLSASEAEMDSMLKGMRADAEADKTRILANAEKQAAAVKRDAELRIAAEIQRARVELAREVAVAAATAAEQLLRDKTTATDHAALVDGFIRDVEAAALGATTKGAV
ncbi:MAG: ATP synthase F0 subunit B [Kofleriaceae bacterium]